VRSSVSPMPNRLPSNLFHDSMTRSSVVIGSPSAEASGWAVSCTRSSGEATMCVMSRSPMVSATRCAIWRPRSERWKPGRLP
jgi:hypothetical protein